MSEPTVIYPVSTQANEQSVITVLQTGTDSKVDTPSEVEEFRELERLRNEFMSSATPEEWAEDERIWDEKIKNTTPEQIAKMLQMFGEDIAEGTLPLDASNK